MVLLAVLDLEASIAASVLRSEGTSSRSEIVMPRRSSTCLTSVLEGREEVELGPFGAGVEGSSGRA